MANKLPPALFLADSPGLDFLNSLATPLDVPVDWISNGRDFLAWLEEAGFVPKTVLASIARRRRSPFAVTEVAPTARLGGAFAGAAGRLTRKS